MAAFIMFAAAFAIAAWAPLCQALGEHGLRASAAEFLAPEPLPRTSEATVSVGVDGGSAANATLVRGPHHIVYTADSAVFGALTRSMLSVGKHFSADEDFQMHLLVPDKDIPEATTLVACFQQAMSQWRNSSVPVVKLQVVGDLPVQVAYQDRPDLKDHAAASSARLFLPEHLPEVDKVLYLDADTISRGDLAPLFATPMDGALAAVEEGMTFDETWAKWYPDVTKLVSNAKRRTIFNDGVLLLDLQRWRAERVGEDLQQWASRAGARVDDQLLLNLEFQVTKSFTRLPAQWNDLRVRPTGWPKYGWADDLQPEDELSNAMVLHWTGPKPWNIEAMHDRWMKQYQELWTLPGVSASDCDRFAAS